MVYPRGDGYDAHGQADLTRLTTVLVGSFCQASAIGTVGSL
jgi:hypothetical protein